jgi:hypothetical protein
VARFISRRHSQIRTLGALLALGAVVGACGTSTAAPRSPSVTTASPRQAVLDAATRTVDADTAMVDMTISISGSPQLGSLAPSSSATGSAGALSLSITAHGAFDFVNKTGTLTLDVPSSAGSQAEQATVREIGSTLYLHIPALGVLEGGKSWVQVDLSQYVQNSGALGDLSTGDPTQVLGLLQHASSSIVDLGAATVDGVATTHYRATIDLAQLSTTSGAGTSVLTPDQLHQLEQLLGLSSVPEDVWVDAQGRARQMSLHFSVLGLTVTTTLRLSDFGAPVTVTAPPPDQVADGSDLLNSGQLGSLLGGGA